ncbi:uncharacterized protein LOC110463548 isoform X1 [Mizuhopecten yessoensis]|uniref:uncharacterized protein LOC110463548 isoform X1 n=1 Tax=Mizuhopecten yessoensis TaxID=6573 RepID=UPI000B45D1DE|nr:uncharacterized protein LOC110463548 isoform X1 [Mizuhopecten yessoensis]XP_021373887.1 uncharacterized protein LOC110463548 isoform X1 [Mizuhopecten yessoensis]XP_021373888.1 uncharacterized protein LOC110463548 isoform X1 [Mizuhopecten yessoensis]
MKKYFALCLGIGMVLALILITDIQSSTNHHVLSKTYTKSASLDTPIDHVDVSDIKRQIIDVALYLKQARLHARGSKTSKALRYACEHMDRVLKRFGTSFENVTKRKEYKSDSVCPEYYVDNIYGYRVQNCSYSKRIEEIVTIVRLDYGSHADSTKFFSNGYGGYISAVVGDYGGNIKEQNRTHVIHLASSIKEGEALNKLIARVKTKYTLVVKNMTALDSDSRIERLVREIERLQVTAVGGSIRNSDSVWSLGCHQRVLRNYTVAYEEGYDESMHDCVFCDHVDGPFLIRTDKLKQVQFDGNLTPMGLYEDFFMRLEGEVAVCPDAMFYMDSPRRSEITTDWEKFGRKRYLYKLKFSMGLTIHFGCNYPYQCKKGKGYVRSPCCVQELADLNNGVMEMCEKAGVPCQLNAGTHLGAVKLYKVIPWEIDGDIKFWCEDFRTLEKAGITLRSKGIKFGTDRKPRNCSASEQPSILSASSKHWHIDIWATSSITGSYILRSQIRDLTRIPHNGRLVYVNKNPALATRNVYPGLFRHKQHPSEGGGGTNVHNRFTSCLVVDNQDCIDSYYEEGNIQFKYTLV